MIPLFFESMASRTSDFPFVAERTGIESEPVVSRAFTSIASFITFFETGSKIWGQILLPYIK